MKDILPGCFYKCNLLNSKFKLVDSMEADGQIDDFIQKVVDGQASENEKNAFNRAVHYCHDCMCKAISEEQYDIKQLLQERFQAKMHPDDLLEKIKSKLK